MTKADFAEHLRRASDAHGKRVARAVFESWDGFVTECNITDPPTIAAMAVFESDYARARADSYITGALETLVRTIIPYTRYNYVEPDVGDMSIEDRLNLAMGEYGKAESYQFTVHLESDK